MSGGLYDRHLKKERLKRSIFLPNCCISRHNKAARNKDSTSLCSIVTLQKRGKKGYPPHDGGDAEEVKGLGELLSDARPVPQSDTAGAPTG